MRPKLKLLLDTFMVSSPTVCLYCINEYVRSPALNEFILHYGHIVADTGIDDKHTCICTALVIRVTDIRLFLERVTEAQMQLQIIDYKIAELRSDTHLKTSRAFNSSVLSSNLSAVTGHAYTSGDIHVSLILSVQRSYT